MTSAAFAARARRDLLTAVRWIAKDNPAAARVLRDTVVHVGAHPSIGVLRPDIANEPYRVVVLTGFPYLIVYNAARRPPLILRILHGARNLPEVLREI